jgi:hypothetical protein
MRKSTHFLYFQADTLLYFGFLVNYSGELETGQLGQNRQDRIVGTGEPRRTACTDNWVG